MKKPLLLLIDGNALVHRAFHALPVMTVPRSGEMVNAVFGFASSLLKVLSELRPGYCAVAFDRGLSFRRETFEEYKSQRKETAVELKSQFPRVRELVRAFGTPVFEVEGFEADDVLGSLSRQAAEEGIETVIFTGDADAMQLVSEKVGVLVPGRTFKETVLYDPDKVRERYGVSPEQITDLKALMGDPSDNIPGISGIGEKTAARLLQEFGSIEGIYEDLEKVNPPRVRDLLRGKEEQAKRSRDLVTIIKDVPVELKLHECSVGLSGRDRLVELFRELGFVALLSRLPQAEPAQMQLELGVTPAQGPDVARCIIRTQADLDRLLSALSSPAELALEVHASGASAMSAEPVGLSLCLKPGEAFYLPLGHREGEQLPLTAALDRLRPFLADTAFRKVGHNLKFAALVLSRYGVELAGYFFDTMVAAHLVGEKSLGLAALSFRKLGVELPTVSDLLGKGVKQVPLVSLPAESVAERACAAIDATMRLRQSLEEELRHESYPEGWKLFQEVEMPLLPVLVQMERCGVALDSALLHDMSRNMSADLQRLELEAYNAVGHQFNLNSPQQLSRVLFEELGLPRSRKTQGGYSTDASILEELRTAHPVINKILEYRQLAKLKSTYLDALPELVNPATGRLHTSFNQTGTTTGRLSSSEPNLQNIPVRGELGRKIRYAFIAPPGSCLVAADYSQIDLRVLAHLSQDPALMGAFQRDEDIHSATASAVFGVPITAVTPDMRRVAKTVNFGVVYGMSEYGLEQATDLTREQSAAFIHAYFEKYPGVKAYLEATKRQARDTGHVQTLLGLRRYVPEVRSPNRMVREAAERMAINMPVQGTSADIIKVAMVQIHRRMRELGLKCLMTLQVHDELIFEAPEGEVDAVKRLALEIMPNAVRLSVPVKVDVKTGQNWGEME